MMKKIWIAIFAVSLMASCTSNGSKTEKTSEKSTSDVSSAAKITFAEETFDFGTITEGDKVSHEFKFKNDGETPLIISDAQASCGCTVPEYPKTPIAPGQEGVISVVFDSAGKFGKQNKVVTITSNAAKPQTAIYLVGEINEKK